MFYIKIKSPNCVIRGHFMAEFLQSLIPVKYKQCYDVSCVSILC